MEKRHAGGRRMGIHQVADHHGATIGKHLQRAAIHPDIQRDLRGVEQAGGIVPLRLAGKLGLLGAAVDKKAAQRGVVADAHRFVGALEQLHAQWLLHTVRCKHQAQPVLAPGACKGCQGQRGR